MANRRTFGRRAGPQPALQPVRPQFAAVAQPANAAFKEIVAEPSVLPPQATKSPSLDRELSEWKRTRGRAVKIPWRPLSLMASLCFGVASFVLPDAINDVVQWPLYVLMAASFYAGVSTRRRNKSRGNVQPGTRGP